MVSVNRFGRILILTALLVIRSMAAELPGTETADLLATRLNQTQLKEGPNQGLWPPEVMFVGPATTGMVCAYEWTGNRAYRAAAELGGQYIMWVGVAQGQLLGDEVYAFLRLSEIADDPNDNTWQAALVDFFAANRRRGGTTLDYLSFFDEMEPSAATFYVAHHTVGAYYVDDSDKELWREALIERLSRIDDESGCPVMALGVATWALAETGELDETPVARVGSKPYWDTVLLRDLPGLLLSHQVPEGESLTGSFYWRFDHTGGGYDGPVSGYTEDAIYGALGLNAAAGLQQEASHDLEQGITAVYRALIAGVDADGEVYEHLTGQGQSYHAYAGEMLHALWAIAQHVESQETPPAVTEIKPAVQ